MNATCLIKQKREKHACLPACLVYLVVIASGGAAGIAFSSATAFAGCYKRKRVLKSAMLAEMVGLFHSTHRDSAPAEVGSCQFSLGRWRCRYRCLRARSLC